MGILYVVATPIGNLGDVSERTKKVLAEASVVFAEDTRITLKLTNHLGLSKHMVSCHSHTSDLRLQRAIKLLDDGDACLVTDAGTPTISDPGAKMINMALAAGHTVSPIPGASALIAALSVSGFPADRFTFCGFLPRTAGKRTTALNDALSSKYTVVVYESPHRVIKLLETIKQLTPERLICVCRELTKLYEEIFRGTADEALRRFSNPRGEFVVVIDGKRKHGNSAVNRESSS